MATEKIMVMMTCNYGGSLYLLWLGSARSSFCLSLPLLLPSPRLSYNQKFFKIFKSTRAPSPTTARVQLTRKKLKNI